MPIGSASERYTIFSGPRIRLRVMANVIAMTLSLIRGPENIVYRSEAEPIGMASWFFGKHRIYEQAVLEQVDGHIIPLTYRYTHQGSDENRNEYYRYNWTGHVAQTNYRGTQR